MRRRALALIVVLGILGVLGILATCFITLSRLERQASQRRIHQTQALLLARSGIEDALARMHAGQDAVVPGNAYQGEDWDGNGQLSVFEADQEIFRRTGAGTAPDTSTCPVEQAMRPSFFVRVPGADNPDTRSVDGRQRGRSGTLSTDGILSYGLKVEDESGKLCVNGGFLDARDRDLDGVMDFRDPDVPGRGWNGQLTRILGNLGRRLGLPTLGNDLMTRRPEGGYRNLAEVQAAAGTSADLSPYLSLAAWVDTRVIRPNARTLPYTHFTVKKGFSDLKKARGPLVLEEGGRPPVNLNAASKPVLGALLEGIHGEANSRMLHFSPVVYAVTAASTDRIVDALVTAREAAPFGTWPQFEAWVDSLVPTCLSDTFDPAVYWVQAGNLGAADLIKANFNPNTMLAKQMPDEVSWRWMDKSDLLAWSTEGSLGPTGDFRIGTLGRVLSPEGALLASAGASVTVRAFDLLRQTTQGDFVAGRSPDAGDTSYLSLANASPSPPFPPQRTTGAGASWNIWNPGQGLAVTTYPCPMTALPDSAADFDGSVGLATVEFPETDPPYPGTSLRFLHHFDDGWTADRSSVPGGTALLPGPPGAGEMLPDAADSVWPSSALVEPNTLCPDGIHLQPGRSPSYSAWSLPQDTDPDSDHGVILFWTKRFTGEYGGGYTDFFCVRSQMKLNYAVPPVLMPATQVLAVGGSTAMGNLLESWAAPDGSPPPPGFITSDHNHERGMSQKFEREAGYVLTPCMRWNLVAALHDNDEILGREVYTSVMGLYSGAVGEYAAGWPYHTATGEKLVQDPAQTFTLGASDSLGSRTGFRANAIMDEFAILDLGDDAGTARGNLDLWARERFSDGRYYKGDDGTFLSTEIRPSGGAPFRMLSASWTERLPTQERLESVHLTNEIVDRTFPRLKDARLSRARLEVALLEGAGTLTSPELQALDRPGGTALGRNLQGFRYRVRFVCQVPDPWDDPVLETPFLDDITFAWQPASGPRILAWER